MNIYYMGENLTNSEFPIKVWNDQVPRNVGATKCLTGEYESQLQLWGEHEKGTIGADAGLLSVNNTDKDRKDSFPKEGK